MRVKRQIKGQLKKYSQFSQPTPAILGNLANALEVPGKANYVYARLLTGEIIEVYNDKVFPSLGLNVYVGYDPNEKSLLQILSIRSSRPRYQGSTKTIYPFMGKHHLTHEWMATDGGDDIVFSQLRQFMPLRPQPSDMSVFVYRGFGWINDRWMQFTGSSIDLYSYIPSSGARYNLVYEDVDGLLDVSQGVIKDLGTLSILDIPDPVPGTYPIAAVRTYAGQTGIAEARSMLDIIDLRFPMWHDHAQYSSGSSAHVIMDEGSPLTQRPTIDFRGAGVFATDSPTSNRTTVTIPGTINIFDNSTFKVSGTAISFVDGLVVHVTGTTAYIDITGSFGHTIQDDGVGQTQRTNLNFVGDGFVIYDDAGNDATIISGTASGGSDLPSDAEGYLYNDGLGALSWKNPSPVSGAVTVISTYMLSGMPLPLGTATGTYWYVPGLLYASGSLSIFLNGVAQLPGIDFFAQHPSSGTFYYSQSPPTGSVHMAIWGVPVFSYGL